MNRLSEEGSWETGGVRISGLMAGLHRLDTFRDVTAEDLEPLRTKGLNHAHVRVRNAKAVLRIPRLSAYGLDPVRNLEYQRACFGRSVPSGVTPRLFDSILPREDIPWGALIVQDIRGETPELPLHLDEMARALAAIHNLPVPDEASREPLISFRDPVQAALRVIEDQAGYLDEAGIGEGPRRMIEEEIDQARAFASAATTARHPVTLVGTDTHPGNFLVVNEGVVFVDLEKMVYGSPAVDLAHASLYTSTMWDDDIATALTDDQVAAFYTAYFDQVPPPLREGLRCWCEPMRRLTWLRTTTWCAKWRVQARRAVWSPQLGNPDYMARISRRFDDYFDPGTIEQVRVSLAAGIPS